MWCSGVVTMGCRGLFGPTELLNNCRRPRVLILTEYFSARVSDSLAPLHICSKLSLQVVGVRAAVRWAQRTSSGGTRITEQQPK